MELRIHATFGATDRATHIPLFLPGGRAVHRPNEEAHGSLSFPAVVKRLTQTVFPRRVAPAQAVSVDEDDPAQHAAIIHARPLAALREKTVHDGSSAHPSATTGHPSSVSSQSLNQTSHVKSTDPESGQWLPILVNINEIILGMGESHAQEHEKSN